LGDSLEKFNDTENSGKTRRRSRLGIIAGILHAAADGTVKTRIMYRANVNFVQFNEYVELLLEARLIATTRCGRRTFYKTTEKGRLLLRRFNETEEIIMAPNGKGSDRPPIVKKGPMVYLVRK
jgi:predicted transcriptional regulator